MYRAGTSPCASLASGIPVFLGCVLRFDACQELAGVVCGDIRRKLPVLICADRSSRRYGYCRAPQAYRTGVTLGWRTLRDLSRVLPGPAVRLPLLPAGPDAVAAALTLLR